ncbi:MAG: plasmid stabilization protein [Gammaproteobacteria bacterium RBG_16_51_14]|nr:MAG: plasmid stabilization protein [Gammaproteobacteria bacterium RBG_16_51_14]
MKRMVRLREEADQDLAVAATWYEQQCSGLGQEFLDKGLSTFQLIAEQPLMYPMVHRNIRRALMSRFPFGIYFRIERSYIVVLAVMHASRDPIHWQSRT